ncbi:hypothetical protein LguiA_021309 [Lonicera macranthoides]
MTMNSFYLLKSLEDEQSPETIMSIAYFDSDCNFESSKFPEISSLEPISVIQPNFVPTFPISLDKSSPSAKITNCVEHHDKFLILLLLLLLLLHLSPLFSQSFSIEVQGILILHTHTHNFRGRRNSEKFRRGRNSEEEEKEEGEEGGGESGRNSGGRRSSEKREEEKEENRRRNLEESESEGKKFGRKAKFGEKRRNKRRKSEKKFRGVGVVGRGGELEYQRRRSRSEKKEDEKREEEEERKEKENGKKKKKQKKRKGKKKKKMEKDLNTPSMHMKITREVEFVKKVVEEVLSKLKKNYQQAPKYLVGMDSHIEEMEGLLNSDSNGLRIIGILGMGGLGKTTIAKTICKLHFFLRFSKGKLIVKDYKIKDVVQGKNVFLVLDDVDNMSQIEKLFGDHSWCYRPSLMDNNLALQLFSKHAFMRDFAPEDYDALAKKVVSSAGSLPLVLVTLGSLLFIEKDRSLWQKKLEKLQELPPPEVLGRLRISYDALDNAQKQIFLDITCLFSGKDKTNPYYMWDDCKFYPSEGINALVRRSLITIGDDIKLWMHDRLRELGEQIICEEWRFKDGLDVLETHLVRS